MIERINQRAAAIFAALGMLACSSSSEPVSPGFGGSNISGGVGSGSASSGTTSSLTGGKSNSSFGGVVAVGRTSTGGRAALGGSGGIDTGMAGGVAGRSAGGRSGSGGIIGTPLTVGGASTGGRAPTGGRYAGGSTATGGRNGGAAGGAGGTSAGGMNPGGSGSGVGGYRPCPTGGDPCKILPLGDSITWGIGYDGAYRVQLFSKAVAAQQRITFTGSVANGPSTVAGVSFPRSNEGHSGWTIAQIAGLVPSPALNTIPHIVLLMIGTNDIYAASGQATMPDRLGSLMDEIIEAAPNALLVVAKITPLANASWNATIKTYNDAIPGLVQKRAAAGKHVILADMNTGFAASMLSSDNVHPNKAGYDFMGDRWYALISDLLPK